ncbi:MAG: 50S ribosomal protein L23 [Oscillospiraceae bacterium]|nr:50S ribosomal protein L23 [Oscillospiraceae bacterium]
MADVQTNLNQKLPQDIIISPVITEKANDNLLIGKYTFKVAKDSNKIEIKKAVESLFDGVKVQKVNTMNVRGQFRRQGRNRGGYTASWKKAIVTLAEGSKTIEFFEGMV